MRTYSLVFLDIDGTLLDSRQQVMPQTKQILHRLEQRGIPVILCSARSPGGVETVAKQADLHGPAVCYGGGLILTAERSILSDEGMRKETAAAFKQYVREHFPDVVVSAYLYDVWLVDDVNHPSVRWEAEVSKCTPLAGNLQAAAETVPHVHKLLAFGTQRRLSELRDAAAKAFPDLTLARSSSTYLEIMSKAVSKRKAVERLQEYYHVSREEIVAFGDHFVDLEMLQYAGLGVAMGNAPGPVQKAAAQVTASHDEEGIYIALKHLHFRAPRI